MTIAEEGGAAPLGGRKEVELTEEVLGRGGWGEVRVAKFRGLSVAAKFFTTSSCLIIIVGCLYER